MSALRLARRLNDLFVHNLQLTFFAHCVMHMRYPDFFCRTVETFNADRRDERLDAQRGRKAERAGKRVLDEASRLTGG